MPTGRIHSATTAVLAAALYYAASRAGYPAAPLAGGCMAGILLSPDLDVDNGSISDAHARRLGGCAVGLAWSILWKPYAYLIPHRSPLSHAPLIGTALRVAYLALLAQILIFLFHLTGIITAPRLPAWWPWAFAGLAVSDLAHYVMDKTIRIKYKHAHKPD